MAKAGEKLPKKTVAKELVFRLAPGELERLRLQRTPDELERLHRAEEDRRVIDRAEAMRLRPWPTPKHKKKIGGTSPGRPRDYEDKAILKIAEDLLRGYAELPRTLELFKEKVADACKAARVAVPERTKFSGMLSPLYRQKKRRRTRKSR
jgi:hypothetical protein